MNASYNITTIFYNISIYILQQSHFPWRNETNKEIIKYTAEFGIIRSLSLITMFSHEDPG
mgnify:CR=1 FL=1